MIRNGMWDVLSITDPLNKEKEWDLLLHQSRYPLEYIKRHVQSLLKLSEADQYIFQNLTWSGVYLSNNLSNTLLQKVLTLVPLTATGPEVYVATMNTIISDSYYSVVGNLNHMKSLYLKDHSVRDVADCYDAIFVHVESLDIAGSFKPDHLGYIILISGDTYDSRFHLWETQKYKEVMEYSKKPLFCYKDVMQTDDIITYGSLVQESFQEYSNIFESKWWEPTDIENISKDEYLLLTASTVAIEFPVNKTVEKVYRKICHKGKDNKSGVGSSTKSDVTCHNCGKKGHLKRNCKSNRNGYNG